jgi:hypothetical protein
VNVNVNDPTMNDRDALDDAIDRTVRDMTHAAADERAVARVMARLREAESPAAGHRWVLSPRVAWCGLLALLLMALMSMHSWRWFPQSAEERRAAATTPQPSSEQPRQPRQSQPLASREFPTPVLSAPSTVHAATAARIARRGDTVRPASVASGRADADERHESEMTPLESDIELASITPAPLGDASAIQVAPLTTTALTVDEIPVTSIDMPPVSPEQQR